MEDLLLGRWGDGPTMDYLLHMSGNLPQRTLELRGDEIVS